jgi:hypothetical protein
MMKPELPQERDRNATPVYGSVPDCMTGAEPASIPTHDEQAAPASPKLAMPPGKHVPHWPKYLIAVGVFALVGMELATRSGWFAPEADVSPGAAAAHADKIIAQQERLLAEIALSEARWQDCLDDLDRAAARDPLGDKDARVIEERGLARERLRGPVGGNPLP